MGQDTVQTAIYRDKVFWIWGDTQRAAYPLGNFRSSGGESDLPGRGGLAPDLGVNLRYFVDEKGFSRAMVEDIAPSNRPTWLGAMITLPDAAGRAWLFAAYMKAAPDLSALERGLVRFDDERGLFARVVSSYPLEGGVIPEGHPTLVRTDTLTMTSSVGRTPLVWVTRGSDRITASTVAEARPAARLGTRPASRALEWAAVAIRQRAVPKSVTAGRVTQDLRRQPGCMSTTPIPAETAAASARTIGRSDSMAATQIHASRAGTRSRASNPGRSADPVARPGRSADPAARGWAADPAALG